MKIFLKLVFKRKLLVNSLADLFKSDAKEFANLYTAIYKISKKSNENYSAIKEFYKRIPKEYKDNDAIKIIEIIVLSKKENKFINRKLAKIIYNATKEADIIHPAEGEQIILTDETVFQYNDVNGEKLYVDDVVIVKAPAWYQNEKLLEIGYCELKKESK